MLVQLLNFRCCVLPSHELSTRATISDDKTIQRPRRIMILLANILTPISGKEKKRIFI